MDTIIERGCGLDVHQSRVVACVLVGNGRKPRKEIRTFGTMARDLRALKEWLLAEGCTHVGMESTGIYWVPVYAALEGDLEIVVGNATRIKNVPGRKTDVKDSEWLAQLLRHGLIPPSFVPPLPLRQLRALVRYRRKLTQSRTNERNRLLKLLESSGIKLASVASDVFGVSGMRMLRALAQGVTDAAQIADLAQGKLRRKIAELSAALDGRVDEPQRFLLQLQLRRLDDCDRDLADLDARIDHQLEPYREQHTLLMEIPGVDRVVAATIIAEIGIDMTVFKTAGHLAAWGGVCPGNYESAGRRLKDRARKGNVHLRTALVQAAFGAARSRGGYLRDKYFRLKARRGAKRAAVAIAHKILLAAYAILQTGRAYKDLGDSYLDDLHHKRVKSQLVRRLERLGYRVTVEPNAAA